ncbi:phage portal protein [Mesorhizobium sp. BH1-1-5]|uniref:phage portal protein n=1 Tax=Mesorhizobium sp. BH1-1-5 TaxID=2876661 RepID=UPI001CCE9651|nr:phage portal protein [Mesorhizobium sp. BH1-1-5]MBZ9985679.1 phage portal protein [Mesorhizobium sp. BH1-1-5]
MAFWSGWFGKGSAVAIAEPRAAVQSAGLGRLITTSAELEEAMRAGSFSSSGTLVTADTAMRSAAVYACTRIRSSVVANLPIDVKLRVDDRTRKDASDHWLWKLLRRRPNRWQTPSQFKRMQETHLLLRGNAYSLIVWSRGEALELIPLHPDRVECKQADDLSLSYVYTRKDGRQVTLSQKEVMHLVGLTLDGVNGVSVLTYARETIGLDQSMANHGSTIFKNGARVSIVLKHPQKLGKEGLDFLKASLDDYRSGGESEGKALILEEGMDTSPLAMTSEDAQWIESRKFSRTDIAMFFGVPPHMIGDTEKSTSWGTGLEQQTQGFITFSAEDDLTTWEETITRDLIPADEPNLYVRFNRAALVRGDIKTRWEAYSIGRQLKVMSANDVRAMEDMNPIEGGDVYENPLITVDKSKEVTK